LAQRGGGYAIKRIGFFTYPLGLLLSNTNKESALIHSRKIAKDVKTFALSHVLEEGMFRR
jgi:hypothetical protein